MTDSNSNISEHWHYFVAAIMFYTRIPVPNSAQHSDHILNKSRIYFPVIGWLIGGIAVFVYFISTYFFSTAISIFLSIVTSVLATGAFHEDGFADSCDGLGGGWNRDQVLTIMKDSRIGTYATVGLILMLSGKFLALVELSQQSLFVFALIYLNGHCVSRYFASMVIEHFDYIQDSDQSKVKPITNQRFNSKEWLQTSLFAIISIIALGVINPSLTLAVIISAFSALVFIQYCNRRIGGYTGDILGATQQISELVFYFSVIPFLT